MRTVAKKLLITCYVGVRKISNNRPIPSFLFIDQPTQVYFPSIDVYNSADGSIERTEEDADLVSVRRLFKFLLTFTQEFAPGFQIIIRLRQALPMDSGQLQAGCFVLLFPIMFENWVKIGFCWNGFNPGNPIFSCPSCI